MRVATIKSAEVHTGNACHTTIRGDGTLTTGSRRTSLKVKLDALVKTPFRAILPPLALAPGPFFRAIQAFYESIKITECAIQPLRNCARPTPEQLGRTDGF